MTTLSEFQEFVSGRHKDRELWFLGLGFAGETGEAVDEIKKYYRGYGFKDRDLLLELGDSFHYFIAILQKLDLSLEDVMAANVEKLLDREKNGKR